MSNQPVSDQILAAMDLTAVMVATQLAAEDGISPTAAVASFLQSNTARELYDDSLKLWWDGPTSVLERFRLETSPAT